MLTSGSSVWRYKATGSQRFYLLIALPALPIGNGRLFASSKIPIQVTKDLLYSLYAASPTNLLYFIV